MTIGDLTSILRSGIFQVLLMASPVLGAALVVGLIVAIFQATTSIQEQTLTFVPKVFAIFGVLALISGWMFASMRQYTLNIFNMIPQLAQ